MKKIIKIKSIKRSDFLIGVFTFCIFVYTAFSVFKIITTSAPDFPSYYYATVDLTQHINPYTDKNIPNIFIYPPVTSIICLPLIIFPYFYAQGIFIILSVLSVPFIIFFSLKLIYEKFSWRHLFIFISLAFLSFPTKFTLGMGQINLLALLFLILGFYYLQKEKKLISSFLIAIAMLAKPILAFMIIFFFVRKEWKTIFLIITNLILFFLISFLLYGVNAEIYYIQHIVPGLITGTHGREIYYNQGIMGFIARLNTDSIIRSITSILFGFFAISYSVYFILKQKMNINIQFAFFITLLPIVHTLSWQHYFVVLIFPFILAIRSILDKKQYSLLPILTLSYFLVSWNIKNPSSFAGFPQNILLSHTFFGGIILLLLLFKISKYYKK